MAAYDARRPRPADPSLDLAMAVDALRGWNFHVDKESTGATVFRFWRSEYAKLRPESIG